MHGPSLDNVIGCSTVEPLEIDLLPTQGVLVLYIGESSPKYRVMLRRKHTFDYSRSHASGNMFFFP